MLASFAGVFALLVVGGGLVASHSVAVPERGISAPKSPSEKPFETPEPAAPVSLNAVAEASDAFDWWQMVPSVPTSLFLASDDAQDGEYSLVVVSKNELGSGVAGQLSQVIPVVSGVTYTISFWTKSVTTAEGSVEIRPGLAWAPVIPVPTGTGEWQHVTSEYMVPANESAINLRVVVQGPTEGTWIDGVSVVAPDGSAASVNNSGFEVNSADLTITSSSLLLAEGAGSIDLATRRTPTGWLHWTANDSSGAEVAAGDELFSGFTASVDLSEIPRGFYTFNVQATLGQTVVTRATTFGVVEARSATRPISDSRFGTHLHFDGGEARTANLINTLAFAGIGHVRSDISWTKTETEPGVYTYPAEIEAAMKEYATIGMTPLLLPVYANKFYDNGRTPSTEAGLEGYANFASDMTTRFKSAGQDLEVYNEFDHTFNTGDCGKTPQCYISMLTATATTVKAANPDAVVVAPGNAGMGFHFDWLTTFFELGGLDYTDVVSAHPYSQPAAPDTLAADLDTLGQLIKDANGGVTKPIWLTEMGWATVPGWVSDQQQAEWLVRTMALSFGHGVSRVYWYEAADSSMKGDIEASFGMFEAPSSFLPNTHAPKLSAVTQAVVDRKISDKEFNGTDEVSAGVNSYSFGTASDLTRIIWSDAPTAISFNAKGPVTVTSMLGEVTHLKPTSGRVTLELSSEPVYLEGSVSGVSVK